jgi:hypothetical protein
MGHRPLLRPVQPAQAQPVGLRRPGNRGQPPPVRLDEDRPARADPGRYTPYDPALAQYWADRRRPVRTHSTKDGWEFAQRQEVGVSSSKHAAHAGSGDYNDMPHPA